MYSLGRIHTSRQKGRLLPCLLRFGSDLFADPSVMGWHVHQGSVVQMLDTAVYPPDESHPADKYWGNQLRYPLDSVIHFSFEQLEPNRRQY